MANKPQGKNWKDVQMAITAISITATLAFWNLFSVPDTSAAAADGIATDTVEPPQPTDVIEPTAAATATAMPKSVVFNLKPVKIIYGGTLPTQMAITVTPGATLSAAPLAAAPAAPAPKKKSGSSNPKPVKPPSGGSSKPKP